MPHNRIHHMTPLNPSSQPTSTPTPTSSSDPTSILKSALSHARLLALHDLYFTFLDSAPTPPNAIALLNFFKNDIAPQIYDLVYESSLEPLSTVPLTSIPASFLPFLPDPSTPEFPKLASGLHLLLDQAPRFVFSGVDARWTYGFFATLTLRFARELSALPSSLQPQTVARWTDLGYTFEAGFMRAFSLTTGYIHTEDLEAHAHGERVIETECRIAAERHYGLRDPTRDLDAADENDLTAFPRLLKDMFEGVDEATGPREAVWRLCRVVRVHEPLLRRFGRYPYQNWPLGRRSTEAEEREFFEVTGGFGRGDEGAAAEIRADFEAGRVRPLTGKRPGGGKVDKRADEKPLKNE